MLKRLYLGILHQYLVNFSTGILNKLAIRIEDDQSDFAVAENTELVRLLHQPLFPLEERDLA